MSLSSFDAVLLAASVAVDPMKAKLERHLTAALAAGARRVNYPLTEEVAERLLPVLKQMVKRKIPDLGGV